MVIEHNPYNLRLSEYRAVKLKLNMGNEDEMKSEIQRHIDEEEKAGTADERVLGFKLGYDGDDIVQNKATIILYCGFLPVI